MDKILQSLELKFQKNDARVYLLENVLYVEGPNGTVSIRIKDEEILFEGYRGKTESHAHMRKAIDYKPGASALVGNEEAYVEFINKAASEIGVVLNV